MKRIIAAVPMFLFIVWAAAFVGIKAVQAQEHGERHGSQEQQNLPQKGRDFGRLKLPPIEGAAHGDAAAAGQLAPAQLVPGVILPGNSVPLFFSNNPFPLAMVGTDPSIPGAGETDVPVLIIPLRLNFIDGNGNLVASISPNNIGCNDNQSALSRVVNSPLFVGVNWIEGGTVVGVNTQFTDAFQRANFWTFTNPGSVSPNYHVLLTPVQILPEVTVPVTPGLAVLANGVCPGNPIAAVNQQYLDGVVQTLISALNIPPTVLPLFLTYDIGETVNGGCCFLGYHQVAAQNPFNPGVFTYAVSSYVDPNVNLAFGIPLTVSDISILSHELGEWMDDPLGNNIVPRGWRGVGQATGCQVLLEVGDPLIGTNSNVFMADGTIYTVQDLAFFSWFARQNPSIAVNGWYTTLNSFPTFSVPCQ
jgi:hypothetical protein